MRSCASKHFILFLAQWKPLLSKQPLTAVIVQNKFGINISEFWGSNYSTSTCVFSILTHLHSLHIEQHFVNKLCDTPSDTILD